MDNAKTIGKIVGHTGVRDAIHVPNISALAKTNIAPGSPVKIDAELRAEMASSREAVGVADPYLREPVQEGVYFWVLIRPGSI